jgi:hypothetical protein
MLRSRLVTIGIKPTRLHVTDVYNIALARERNRPPKAEKEKWFVIVIVVLALSGLKNTSPSRTRASDF